MAERELLLSLQTLGSDFNPEHTDILRSNLAPVGFFFVHEVFGF